MRREEAAKILREQRDMFMIDHIVVTQDQGGGASQHGVRRQYGDLNDQEKAVYDAFVIAISVLEESEGTEKVVVVKHFGDNGHYLFSVPMCKSLKAGDSVIVKNKKGETTAKCVCDSFEVQKSVLKALAERYGATLPLAPVVGVMRPEWW